MGRFINADSLTSTGQGFVGYNMFAYCLNNPVRYSDSQGTQSEDADKEDEDGFSLVGAGVQIDASGSLGIGSVGASVGFGFEVIIYWDTPECAALGEPIVAIYVYNEGSAYLDTRALYDQAMEIAELLLENIDVIKMDGTSAIEAILSGSYKMNASVSFSISALGVWANSDFYGVDSYSKGFENLSVTAGSVKYGYAWSDCCKTHSLGYSYTIGKPALYLDLPTISRGKSYYRVLWDSRP